jgi:ATP-binding cassette subfamily F protein 3
VGANGNGKTTLLKLIMNELQPTSGYIFRNQRIRIAKFTQHHVDQLVRNPPER